jgi:drug/metabolite transporter (DMT)-like permease
MAVTHILLLLALSAIWGSSFMFMRILAPLIGPVATTDLRLLVAAAFLFLLFLLIRFKPAWRRNWKHFLAIGVVNSAIPFLLYSFASLYLPASVEVIFNSLSPLFGALFSLLWLGDKLTVRKSGGLALGIGGVVVMSSLGAIPSGLLAALGVAACLFAPMCYGLAGVYMKKKAMGVKPMAVAGGSQLSAGLLLAPFLFFSPPLAVVRWQVALLVVVFGVLCSAVAYLIYYKLIADIGPTKALTVTFLMPVFGMLWGALFLHEQITVGMLAGAALILAGTFLVTAPPRKAALSA